MVEKSGWSEKGKRSRQDSDNSVEETELETGAPISGSDDVDSGEGQDLEELTESQDSAELETETDKPARDTATRSVVPSRPSKRAGGKTAEEVTRVSRVRSDRGASKVARAAATAGQTDATLRSRLGFPALVALICILGLLTSAWAWQARDATAAPRQNADYWLSVYGVYDCTRDGGDKWVPKFLSVSNNSGISSRSDGLIHINPTFEASSGKNARMHHWFNEMGISVTPDMVILDNGAALIPGTECADGSGPAEIKILQWNYDFEALADHPPSNIYTEDFGNIRFMNDREVFVIAFAAADTEIPNPPSERFELLDRATDTVDYSPAELVPGN